MEQNIEDIIEEITLEELQDDDSLIEDVEEIPEAKSMKKEEDEEEVELEDDENEEEEDDDDVTESVIGTAALATVGVVGTLAALYGVVKGASWAKNKVGNWLHDKAYELDQQIKAAERKAKKEEYESKIQSIVDKFEDDAELHKMYKSLPKYDPKNIKANKERTKQLKKIADHIKGKLTNAEYQVFNDISKSLRSKYESYVTEAIVMEATEPQGGIDELGDEDHVPTPEEIANSVAKGTKKTSKTTDPKTDELDDEDDIPTPDEVYDEVEDNDEVVSKAKKPIGEDVFSEEFQEQAEALFEERVHERVEEIQDEIVEKVNSYLDYVVENWMSENELAVERGLRTEIAENFIEQMKDVFIENYIEVPENRIDLVESMEDEIQNLEEELDKTIQENVEMNETVTGLVKKYLIKEASWNLSANQSSKLDSLLEDVAIDDVDEFKSKIEEAKQSILFKEENEYEEEDTITEDFEVMDEGAEINTKPKNKIDLYADAISKMASRK